MRKLNTPVQPYLAHHRTSVYAKLVESGYSAADFPADNPEWGRTVTKRVKLTEKCMFIPSYSHAG